ncbi:MAG: hypothetical protein ACYTBJ_24110, partial [Planctomycetota bacterium]
LRSGSAMEDGLIIVAEKRACALGLWSLVRLLTLSALVKPTERGREGEGGAGDPRRGAGSVFGAGGRIPYSARYALAAAWQ